MDYTVGMEVLECINNLQKVVLGLDLCDPDPAPEKL